MRPSAPVSRVWVHVFEEDTAGLAVFRPEDSDIPLSRRPRERFRLRSDGTAELLTGGPDDRFIERAGRWVDEDGGIVVRIGGAVRLTIVEQSEGRLLVRLAE